MNCVGFQDTTAIPLVFATVLGYNSTIDGGIEFENEAIEVVLVYTIFVTGIIDILKNLYPIRLLTYIQSNIDLNTINKRILMLWIHL